MHDGPDSAPARRLRLAFELHEAGVALKRLSLQRRHPGMTDAQTSALLRRWLARVGEPLDAPGVARPWSDAER